MADAVQPGSGPAPVELVRGEEQGFSWKPIWDILFHRRWVICGVTALVVLVVTVWVFRATPIFRATVRLLIERDSPNPINVADILPMQGQDPAYYLTQYKLIESRRIAERAFARLNLREDPVFKDSLDPVAAFQRLVIVEPVRNSRLVDVHIEHPVPAVAAAYANAIAAAYIEDTMDRRTNVGRDALRELKKEGEVLRGRLDEQEKAMLEFKEKNALLSANDRQSLLERRLEELSTQLTVAEKDRRDAEASMEKLAGLQREKEDAAALFAVPQIQSNPLLQKLREDQVKALQDLEELSKKFKAKHPAILAAQSRLDSLTDSLRQEVARAAAGLRAQYEQAMAREGKVRETVEGVKSDKIQFDRNVMQLNSLQREADATRSLYQNILRRTQETNVTSSSELSSISVVDPAIVPTSRIRPRRTLTVMMGLLGGLFLGVLCAFVVEQMDSRIDAPEEVERYLRVPLLGVIPHVGDRKRDVADANPDLVCHEDLKSHAAEAFRSIRTALQFSGGADHPIRSLAVVSAMPQEGKTTTIVNLGIVMAQTDLRVLVVDADLRRPRIHKSLGVPGHERGLSAYLIGESTLEQAMYETRIKGLWCVPAGPIPPNPSELLGSPRLGEFLREVFGKFDRVLFDSAPVGAVTDACVLARHLDGVIQVIGFGQTSRHAACHGKDQLVTLGARYLGAILNNVPLTRRGYGYYYGYGGYYYRYGSYYGQDQDGKGGRPKAAGPATVQPAPRPA